MPTPRKTKELKSLRLRNAYRLNLATPDYNVGKSARHPTSQERVKMYAELARTTPQKRKKPRIKSHGDNILEYQWKQAYANISITRSDELMNSGDAQVVDLLKAKTQIAEKTLADYIQGGLYHSGTTAKSIVGTGQFLSTSNTVGGISQSSYSWWQAQIDSSTTTLTLAAMQTIFNSCTINNSSPTVIMATRANYNRYYALLQPQQRFVDGDTAKGGFQNLLFNGVPLIAGSKVPTSNLQFLNEEHLGLFVMKEEDFRFEPFAKPLNQNLKSAKIYWMGAHGTDNCRMLGGLTAIAA